MGVAGHHHHTGRLVAVEDRRKSWGFVMTGDSVKKPTSRRISPKLRTDVLTEAGYRCAVPTCRMILALDIHHILQVSENGPNELSNLIALCPTCHRLFHLGYIARDSLYAWKGILVSLSRAFDVDTVDYLLFLSVTPHGWHTVSGDGILRLARLIVAGLASYQPMGAMVVASGDSYAVRLTEKGKQLVDAWKSGNRHDVAIALGQQQDSHV